MVTRGPVLRLATRGSPLARWQADRVADLLEGKGIPTAQVVVDTVGDRQTDVPLDRLGGQGIFVKEVQAAVARGDADAAVHSAKDLPAAPELAAPGLVLAAFPERVDTGDVLVGGALDRLPAGATIATGSARRRVQLANYRPDLTFADLRGNLATRLAVVGTGRVAAVVVAKAALDRLGWPPDGVEVEVISPMVMVPQVGQGALAVECREDDRWARAALAQTDDPEIRPLVVAERAFLAELGGGCTLPLGANAAWAAGRGAGDRPEITLTGMLASSDGLVVLRHAGSGADPVALGRSVARCLLDESGGRDLGEWAPAVSLRAPT
jgi:hydroxymethylbilane synthase